MKMEVRKRLSKGSRVMKGLTYLRRSIGLSIIAEIGVLEGIVALALLCFLFVGWIHQKY